ncbi:MAG: FAD-dependent oxidoreductase [Patescibacteria group bacterium]
MKIKKLLAKIIRVTDISPTAKEVCLSLPEPIDFVAGSFVNVFMEINGEKIRRAYSISSSPKNQKEITLTIRLSPDGVMTPIFWKKDMVGETFEIMGPLGLNTVDKMRSRKIYLFAFGVGAGVVKSITHHFLDRNASDEERVESLVIGTGSRSVYEILYREYFDGLAKRQNNISVLHVVSDSANEAGLPTGFIQDHIEHFDFNNSDVYVCGQEQACNDLVKKINSINPGTCNFFIEGFH